MRIVDADHGKEIAEASVGDIFMQTTIKILLDKLPTVEAVVLPCKIGDTVWGIRKHNRGQCAKQGVVHEMFFGDDMRLCICVKGVCRGEWGRNIFATKEEAETAIGKVVDSES